MRGCLSATDLDAGHRPGRRAAECRPGQQTSDAVEVAGRTLVAKDIVIATGSRTAVPPIEGLAEAGLPREAISFVPTRENVIELSTIGFLSWVGLAYSPSKSTGLLGKIIGGPGKTSIRVGWGMFLRSRLPIQTSPLPSTAAMKARRSRLKVTFIQAGGCGTAL